MANVRKKIFDDKKKKRPRILSAYGALKLAKKNRNAFLRRSGQHEEKTIGHKLRSNR